MFLSIFETRLHDLLIEKADLQENLENVRKDFEEKIKGLVEENGYLSEVVSILDIHFLELCTVKLSVFLRCPLIVRYPLFKGVFCLA